MGANAYHGTGGPLNVAELRNKNPIAQAFIDACIEKGEKPTQDFNGAEQEGVGWYQATPKDGLRYSSAAAYLHPVLNKRFNLDVVRNAHACRVVFEGDRACGVEIIENDNQRRVLRARREVLVSAGTFGSPQLLMLSGIGPQQELQNHGIEPVQVLPGVGENLQEHVDVMVVNEESTARSIAMFRAKSIWKTLTEGIRFLFARRGRLSTVVTEAGAFIKVGEHAETPDIQLHFAPAAIDDHGRSSDFFRIYGHSLHLCVLRPKSRGTVRLASADPHQDPLIDLNLLDHPDDVALLVKAVKRGRELLKGKALDDITVQEILPGRNCESDAELEKFIRRKAQHIYHPVGTCKMGKDDMAVVDEQLRVHGVKGLRVVDASIMPTVVSGNTNAPTIMIAEKAADMILSEQHL